MVPHHRYALARLLLSDHHLASGRGRWRECYPDPIPEPYRLCRFCRNDIESPEQALFVLQDVPWMRRRCNDAESFLRRLS
ncbi:hypothetical protein BKA93DRAFT_813810 [Sparassis latifolia]